jgi:lysozyme
MRDRQQTTTDADLVAAFEGFRARPYLCPASVATIGYGTTKYPDGVKVALTDRPCTRAQARTWLEHDLADARDALRTYVKVPLTAGQRAALASFIYNVGVGAFSRSTLLRLLNRRDYAAAAAEFPRWNKAAGKALLGLTKRRAREREVFEAPDPPAGYPVLPMA